MYLPCIHPLKFDTLVCLQALCISFEFSLPSCHWHALNSSCHILGIIDKLPSNCDSPSSQTSSVKSNTDLSRGYWPQSSGSMLTTSGKTLLSCWRMTGIAKKKASPHVERFHNYSLWNGQKREHCSRSIMACNGKN